MAPLLSVHRIENILPSMPAGLPLNNKCLQPELSECLGNPKPPGMGVKIHNSFKGNSATGVKAKVKIRTGDFYLSRTNKQVWVTVDTQDSQMTSVIPVKEKKLMDVNTKELPNRTVM